MIFNRLNKNHTVYPIRTPRSVCTDYNIIDAEKRTRLLVKKLIKTARGKIK